MAPHWRCRRRHGRATDERPPDSVFIGAWRFADQHDPRAWRAVGEDQLRRRRLEPAAFEALKRGAQFIERRRRGGEVARRTRRVVGSERGGGSRTRLESRRRRGRRMRRAARGRRGALGEAVVRSFVERQIDARLQPPPQRFGGGGGGERMRWVG